MKDSVENTAEDLTMETAEDTVDAAAEDTAESIVNIVSAVKAMRTEVNCRAKRSRVPSVHIAKVCKIQSNPRYFRMKAP